MKKFRFKKSVSLNNKGFSLAEIMIVLVIIGGILGFILPKISEGRDNASVRQTRMRMNEVDTKISEFQADCGKLPTSLDFLVTDVSDCRNWTSNSKNKTLMKDDWQTDLLYEVKGNGYILKSLGKDKKEGGTGPDKDIYSDGSANEE
jgi:general secretion pathway protein G